MKPPALFAYSKKANQKISCVSTQALCCALIRRVRESPPRYLSIALTSARRRFPNRRPRTQIDFRNTLIVFTSNLGADILVGNNTFHPYREEPNGDIAPEVRNAVMDVVNNNYAPEFLNRIDEFIIFKRLSTTALRDIVDIRLRELQIRLDDRRITLSVDDSVREWLAERGYDPRFGARPLNRLISKEIGNRMADKIIRGELKMGDTAIVKVNEAKDGLEISV